MIIIPAYSVKCVHVGVGLKAFFPAPGVEQSHLLLESCPFILAKEISDEPQPWQQLLKGRAMATGCHPTGGTHKFTELMLVMNQFY